MEIVEAEAKKWGSSIGIIIPKDVVEKEKIKEGQKLSFFIRKPIDKKKMEYVKADWDKLRKEVSINGHFILFLS